MVVLLARQGLEDVGKVILFLLPAMCLVESIDHMKGFAVVTRVIVRCTSEKPGRLMPIVCILAFFLSSAARQKVYDFLSIYCMTCVDIILVLLLLDLSLFHVHYYYF